MLLTIAQWWCWGPGLRNGVWETGQANELAKSHQLKVWVHKHPPQPETQIWWVQGDQRIGGRLDFVHAYVAACSGINNVGVKVHPRCPSDGSKAMRTKPEFVAFLFQTKTTLLVERGGEETCGFVCGKP